MRDPVRRQKLIQLRGEKSQAAKAKELGLIQQTYANYELGARTPSPRVMRMFEEHYTIPMEELFPDVFESLGR